MEIENALAVNWKQHRAKLKQHWHSLNDRDLDVIAGDRNVLVSVLQEKYGYTDLTAQAEIDRYLLDSAVKQANLG